MQGSRQLACHPKQLLSWHPFPKSMAAARSCGPCFLEGQEGRSCFTLRSYPQTLLTRIRWQIAISEDKSLPPSVLSLIYPQFSASHWSLTHFSQTFWFYFCLIATLTKTSFHPSFSFPPPIFLVPNYHRWKRNTRQCATAKLNLLSCPSKAQAAWGRAAEIGLPHEN